MHPPSYQIWTSLNGMQIFAATMKNYYGNLSTYVLTWFIIGSINHLYVKKYYYTFWKTYGYIVGAAADTGYNLNMLIVFIAFSAPKTTTMPNRWGNNANSVERCFYIPPTASIM
ncbi:hypothetical protein DFH07DRAFT_969527 [Mycena maculata]|uniref:Uncharacterized protein n=1 Tax=Mycena maculata TaxID=230809 RepID=A0AAD7MRY1_9AGAR|nr:hypothetical protein DFH07DRAFT_969527 [Mycena maculata]